MPLNEIEQHPYLNYFQVIYNGEENVPWKNYRRMIIGSFPIYNITQTIYPENAINDRHLNPEHNMPFFYGSDTNNFWKNLSNCFLENDPRLQATPILRKQSAIELLEANGIILTDVIKNTNRYILEIGEPNPFSPADAALLNEFADPDIILQLSYNEDIIQWLSRAKNLSNIFFTAKYTDGQKNPGWWFHDMLIENAVQITMHAQNEFTKSWHLLHQASGLDRNVDLFFLPTPSAMRTIPLTPNLQHPFLVNYINSVNQDFFAEIQDVGFELNPAQRNIVSNYRSALVSVWWREYLLNYNLGFDGTIN